MPMTIRDASLAFVNGFALTRSFAWPYLISQHDNLLIMRDQARAMERGIEVVAPGLPPSQVLTALAKMNLARFSLCAIRPGKEVDPQIRDVYKSHGFRFGRSEGMFVFALDQEITFSESPATVHRLSTQAEAEALKLATGRWEILPRHLVDTEEPVRQYFATLDNEIVGWVKSIEAQNGCRWVSNMQVRPAFRRRGIAAALMTAMLADDRQRGATHSVLLASHTGAHLYNSIGYERIGTLHLFHS